MYCKRVKQRTLAGHNLTGLTEADNIDQDGHHETMKDGNGWIDRKPGWLLQLRPCDHRLPLAIPVLAVQTYIVSPQVLNIEKLRSDALLLSRFSFLKGCNHGSCHKHCGRLRRAG